jgi:CHAT domain-containing protein/SIR2-like protein
MPECADLEIALHRYDVQNYFATLRFTQPDSAADMGMNGEAGRSDIRLGQQKELVVKLDLEKLREMEHSDQEKYGAELADALFETTGLAMAFEEARALAAARRLSLRVRLYIGPGSPELHDLRWERILDPKHGSPMLTDEKILFSRYLSSWDARPIHLRARSELRALTVIANPPDLERYGLSALGDDMVSQARNALGKIKTELLLGGEKGTLNKLISHLREDDRPVHLRKGYDILYLVCHGEFKEGKPYLWLEEGGPTAGSELIARFRDLRQQPSLVVLASCQGVGKGSGNALAALGPQLADAGVAAVVAMQGNISKETVTQFMPEFFKAIHDGKAVDEATATARGAIRQRHDWWMPVLFMRLRGGHIWYVPHMSSHSFPWDRLADEIRDGECLPILGPGLTDAFIGSRRDVAMGLAEACGFPFSIHDREDLPQVAQFIAVDRRSPRFAPRRTLEYLCEEMLDRYGEELRQRLAEPRANGGEISDREQDRPENILQYLNENPSDLELQDLMEMFDLLLEEVWRGRKDDPSEPHRFLASLPFDIYVTTNPDNLLDKALTNTRLPSNKAYKSDYKRPMVEMCRWNDSISRLPSSYQEEPNYWPDKSRPLVYHLFGRISKPEPMVGRQARYADLLRTVVLTEDDYFDFLIGATSNKGLIPEAVRGALASRTLIFIGFRMDDWNFRVLFRSIMSQQGAGLLGDRSTHVAVQIDPEEDRVQYPERARQYLEERFQRANISLFWGSAEDFIRKLYEAWQGNRS